MSNTSRLAQASARGGGAVRGEDVLEQASRHGSVGKPAQGRSYRWGMTARRGLTIVELMLALTVTALTMGALAVFTEAVSRAWARGEDLASSSQQGRVALERIRRDVRQAIWVTCPESLPDTLVLWAHDQDGANRRPNLREIVLICPHPSRQDELVRITQDVPSLLNIAVPLQALSDPWLVTSLKLWSRAQRTVLSEKTGSVQFEQQDWPDGPSNDPDTQRRMVIGRFVVDVGDLDAVPFHSTIQALNIPAWAWP